LAVHSGKKHDCSTFLEKPILSAYFGEKLDWQHILVKQNMINSTFWEKHDLEHIVGKKHN
jgi:hypothetical protein